MPDPTEVPKIVLIVDDDAAILKMMKARLEVDGYAVLAVSSGHAGLEAVKNSKLLAVLLDLHLVDVDGFEVLKQIKAVKPALPVIMVTGSHDEIEARKAFEIGAWDYVTKPIDFAYLKNILLLQTPE